MLFRSFSGATLMDRYFIGSNLTGAKFIDTRWAEGRLEYAVMDSVDLTRAILLDVTLDGADIASADFTGAR